jgi:hypothetical protein
MIIVPFRSLGKRTQNDDSFHEKKSDIRHNHLFFTKKLYEVTGNHSGACEHQGGPK